MWQLFPPAPLAHCSSLKVHRISSESLCCLSAPQQPHPGARTALDGQNTHPHYLGIDGGPGWMLGQDPSQGQG